MSNNVCCLISVLTPRYMKKYNILVSRKTRHAILKAKQLSLSCMLAIIFVWKYEFAQSACIIHDLFMEERVRTYVQTDTSDFSYYLEKKKRFLKNSNDICSGILLSRWHNALVLKNITFFCGKSDVRTYVWTDHFWFVLISRELDEISQKFKLHLFRDLAF